MKEDRSEPEMTPWDRLDRAFRTVLTVPKDRLLKEEARLKAQRKRKRHRKSANRCLLNRLQLPPTCRGLATYIVTHIFVTVL